VGPGEGQIGKKERVKEDERERGDEAFLSDIMNVCLYTLHSFYRPDILRG
jgi:hypothetical protein